MATVDWYEADGACPTCGDVHHVEGTTSFFDPFGYSNTFRVGEPAANRDDATHLLDERVWDAYWRVREPEPGSARFALLLELEIVRCDCGTRLAPVLQFRIVPNVLTLLGLNLVDIEDPELGAQIDLVRDGDDELALGDLAAVAALPFGERVATLRRVLRAVASEDGHAWYATRLLGPTRCEACGDVRERAIWSRTFQRPFGPDAAIVPTDPPMLYLGSRISIADWQAPRGFSWLRRSTDHLCVLGERGTVGCRCGAGRAAHVERYVRHGDELELVELALRVVRGREDLCDVDLVEASDRNATTDEERIRGVLADYAVY